MAIVPKDGKYINGNYFINPLRAGDNYFDWQYHHSNNIFAIACIVIINSSNIPGANRHPDALKPCPIIHSSVRMDREFKAIAKSGRPRINQVKKRKVGLTEGSR